MKKYDGILIATDFDGTLMNQNGELTDENAEAINYFMANGGRFTLCSGRAPRSLSRIHDKIKPNAPVICHNGATLYDYDFAKYVRITWLNDAESAKALTYIYDNYFDDVEMLSAYSLDGEYQFNKSNNDSIENYMSTFNSVKKNKFLIYIPNADRTHAIQQELASNEEFNKTFEFSRSWSTGLEMLSLDGNKGSGILALKQHLGSINKIVCVGDYENDISMLKIADIGYAVSNACDAAKEAASKITVSNNESAIAKIISEL